MKFQNAIYMHNTKTMIRVDALTKLVNSHQWNNKIINNNDK